MNLALFDFDGTITTHDSFRDFLLTTHGYAVFASRSFKALPWLMGFVLGITARQTAKEKLCCQFFAGLPREEFNRAAEKFIKGYLNTIVRPAALERIKWHQQNGDRVILVSASFEDYLKFWCDSVGIEIIATRLEEKDCQLTGYFATPNCWGPEKVNRIKSVLNLADFSKIYAYGDSKGDREMLAIAHEPSYKPFR